MSTLSPATSLALFQLSGGAKLNVPAAPAAADGSTKGVDAVTYRIAQQVADGKMSEDQGAALSQAWQQIEDIVNLSSQSGAAAFGASDITKMFDALRPALDIKA